MPSHQNLDCRSAIAPYAGQVCLLAVLWFLLPNPPSVYAADSNPSQVRRAVVFGPPKELAELAVTKDSHSVGFETVNVRAKTLHFTVAPSRCFTYPASKGFEYLAVGDLHSAMLPGEPELPMATFTVQLDRRTRVLGVEVKEGQFREIRDELNLIPHCQVQGANVWKVVADPEKYSLGSYLPGMLVSYDTGTDNQNRHVFVHFFPVQYIPAKRRAVLVDRARIELTYVVEAAPPAESSERHGNGGAPSRGEAPTQARCVIICPSKFEGEAQRLADFHTAEEGIPSVVLTTERIDATYVPVEDPPFAGYRDRTLRGFNTITNYNYALSRKVVAFLRDSASHPKLEFVTLFGGAAEVPPSYYHFCQSTDDRYDPYKRDFNSWTPTDLLYASPDDDTVPNFGVGRLPVHNQEEAEHLVRKIVSWHQAADWSWFRKTVLATISGSEVWERHRLLNGLQVMKLTQINERMEKQYVEPALTMADVGILIHVGHSSPVRLGLLHSAITVEDLMSYREHLRVPVVFSTACDSAAFDSSLVPALSYLNRFGGHSVGEAVLLSKAGGIAYFGGTRYNTGAWSFHNAADVLGREFYTSQLLLGCLRAYQEGADTLGGIFTRAVYDYLSSNDLRRDPLSEKMLFQFVLLGDPALRIPAARHH